MAAINQHATVEKKQVNVSFLISYSPYSWFGLNLRHMVMPHMYCEMQIKLSNTRGSPLGSMGEIISSRCQLLTNPPRHHEEETQNTNSHTTARAQSNQGNRFSYLSEMQRERTLSTSLQTNPPRHHGEGTQNTSSHTTART